jgi:hypothetical protein
VSDADKTPPRGTRIDSITNLLANLAGSHNAVAARLVEAARVVTKLTGAERAAYLAALERRLGELADLTHDERRELHRLSLQEMQP